MSLYTKVKSLIDNPEGLLSDDEAMLVGRKDFTTGEASPIGSFIEAFGLRIRQLQDLDFFSSVYFWARVLSNKNLILINYSKVTFFHFLYFNLLLHGNKKNIASYYDYDPNIKTNNPFLSEFVADLRAKKIELKNYSQKYENEITVIFISASHDEFDFAKKLLLSKSKCLIFVRDFCTKKSRCGDYPYIWPDVNSQYLISGLAIFSNFDME